MDSDSSSDQLLDEISSAIYKEKLPLDLKIIFFWLVLTVIGIYMPPVNESFFRVVIALPMVLFIPGYVLIAALFPGKLDIDIIERIALSFGLSIAIVPLIGLALNYTPWGIRLDPIVISLVIFTLVLATLAFFRRVQIPLEERFSMPVHEIAQGLRHEFLSPKSSRLDRLLSIILIISIIAAVATTVYVIVVPKEGETFTEFFILGEKKMAADYPTRLTVGETGTLSIGIGNHEYRNITYTVETYLMTMEFDENTNTSSLQAMDPLDRFTVPVSHNSTVITPYSFSAKKTGYNRIEFLLFNQTVPDDRVKGMDRINQSYRDLHLWVTIRS
jgi:uncharacterized membrane protein